MAKTKLGSSLLNYLAIVFFSMSCTKQNTKTGLPASGPDRQQYLTDGPWIYFGTTIGGYPTDMYDSLFFDQRQVLNQNQYEDSVSGYYTGTRIIIWAYAKFSVRTSPSLPDTIVTVFNPYTAGPTNLDTFLVKTLNDSLMVWGWYDARSPVDEVKYDSLRKSRKY